MRFVDSVPVKFTKSTEYDRDDSYMIGQGGWDVYVTGANGFVGKDGVIKGGLFDAQTGNPWCHKECSRFHPTEVLKMIKTMQDGQKDATFTASKVKYQVATYEKDNTLMHAFGPNNVPLVLKISDGKKAIVVGFGDANSNPGAMTAAVVAAEFNEDCADYDEGVVCGGDCDVTNLTCLKECDNLEPTCVQACSRAYVECVESCPCNTKCTEGCPCSYESDYCGIPIADDVHLLVFDPYEWDEMSQFKFSWLLSTEAKEETIKEVIMETPESFNGNTAREYVCTMTVNNRMFIIGGDTIYGFESRQFEVLNNEVKQLDDLPFSFDQGLCVAMSDAASMACSAQMGHESECWVFDGETYQQVGDLNQPHGLGALAKWTADGNETAVMIGGFDTANSPPPPAKGSQQVEVYSANTEAWSVVTEWDEYAYIYGHTAVGMHDKVFIFGGYKGRPHGRYQSTTVHVLDQAYGFTKHPQHMVDRRSYHQSIVQGNEILHFGGESREHHEHIECWSMAANDNFHVFTTQYEAANWKQFNPIFMIGADDFEN